MDDASSIATRLYVGYIYVSRERLMSVLIRNSSGAELELPLRGDIADELFARVSEALPRLGAPRIGELSAYGLLAVLVPATQPDPRPPTAAQIKFALDIASRLGVQLPPGALTSRSIMGVFLSQYGERLRQR